MNLNEFLESKYVSVNIDNQQAYSVYKQGKLQAIQGMINAQRALSKWANYLSILIEFVLIKIGLMNEPQLAAQIIRDVKEKKEEELKKNAENITTLKTS